MSYTRREFIGIAGKTGILAGLALSLGVAPISAAAHSSFDTSSGRHAFAVEHPGSCGCRCCVGEASLAAGGSGSCHH